MMWDIENMQGTSPFEAQINVQMPRRRLTEQFEEVANKKIIFVCAPGGSGKTATARIWMDKSSREEIWLDLDDLDNSASNFYRTLCTNVVAAQPNNERMQETFRRADFIANPTDYAVQILTEFAITEQKYNLIVDNFHIVTDQALIKSFSQLIKRFPPNFTTIVLSRKEPDASFIPYFQNGQAVMFNSTTLFFDKKEIRNFFALQKKDISQEDAEMISSITGGWPIAVSRMAQDSTFNLDEATYPKSIQMQRLYSYIFEYFWEEWDDETRAFLVRISTLPLISLEIVSKIANNQSQRSLLDSLCTTSTLVRKIDNNSYQFNPLFLDFLENQKKYHQDESTEFFLTIAQQYEQNGKNDWALSYAYKSEDIDLIIDLLGQYSFKGIFKTSSNSEILKDVALSALAKRLSEKYPVLHIFSALIAFREGDSIAFEAHADALVKNRANLLSDYPQFTLDIFLVVAFDYRMTTTRFKQEWLNTDMLEFITHTDEHRSEFLSLGFPFLHHSFKDFTSLFDEKNYAMIKTFVEKLFHRHANVFMNNVESGLALEQNQIPESLKKILNALSLLDYDAPSELYFSTQMQLSMVYFASGKSEYTDSMSELRDYVNRNAPELIPNFLAVDTRLKLWSGDRVAANNWLNNHFVSENSVFMQVPLLEQYYTTGISYLVIGEHEKARQLFFKIRHLAEKFKRPHDVIECEVFLSIICHALNEKEEAQYRLETALFAMQQYELIRVVAKEGNAVLPTLKSVLSRVAHESYDGPLEKAFVTRVFQATTEIGKRHVGILSNQLDRKIKLSKKQQEILELFADGYNREDVVDEMGISINTVKTHINNLYTKLDVQNRTEAVNRAKELGIIE